MECAVENRGNGWAGFNGNQLKLFAIAAMTIDHLTWTLFPGYDHRWWVLLLHVIGRLTAPTMWFMIAEGYFYTRNVKKYISRLFVFAIISHFAYNFCFGVPFVPFVSSFVNQTSVIWPLAWSVVALYILDDEKRTFSLKNWQKTLLLVLICILTFPSDWSMFPVICVCHIYANRGNLKKQILGMELYVLIYAISWFFFIDPFYGIIQAAVIIVWPFMYFYNGQRGSWKGMKWFFYIYYPLHLVLLGILSVKR